MCYKDLHTKIILGQFSKTKVNVFQSFENNFRLPFHRQSPENQERKSKVVEHEKEKTSKSERKRVRCLSWPLVIRAASFSVF